jgi:hypothetical protein
MSISNDEQYQGDLTIALGGACVRVPRMKVAEAKEIIAARERGELEIDESFDPNE